MTKKLSSSWKRIVEWLQLNSPSTLEYFQTPASIEQIDTAASQLGLKLPDELIAFYQIINGAESSGIFPSHDDWDYMGFSPISLEQVVQDWNMLKESLEMGDFVGLKAESSEGIANDWWNIGWIPFASNGGGDYYCIDIVPTNNGTVGQIISHSHESGIRKNLAISLGDYLSDLADLLENNEHIYDDEYGIRRKSEE